MPANIRKDSYFQIVFNCHAKGCLNLLRFRADKPNDPNALGTASARGWQQGKPGDGIHSSRDPWYCPDHKALASRPHRWNF